MFTENYRAFSITALLFTFSCGSHQQGAARFGFTIIVIGLSFFSSTVGAIRLVVFTIQLLGVGTVADGGNGH